LIQQRWPLYVLDMSAGAQKRIGHPQRDNRADMMQKATKPKVKCKNCEGKGLLKVGDKKVRCHRCHGTGFKS
jgi:DnaJ-class molecular chaperone